MSGRSGRRFILPGPPCCRPILFVISRRSSPVGCRDLATLRLLRSSGVDGYFSACLTLTFCPVQTHRRTNRIYVVDCPPRILRLVPRWITQQAESLTHVWRGRPYRTQARFQAAQELLDRYATAAMVVTGRLHCALPCAAFGTPCVFLSENAADPRLEGLRQFLTCPSTEELDRIDGNVRPPDVEQVRTYLQALCRAGVRCAGNPCRYTKIESPRQLTQAFP